MRLLFFNAQALSKDKDIFAWERKIPTWDKYVGEERMILYTTGIVRFKGRVNMRCIGGPLAKLYHQRNKAGRGTPERKKLSREYSARELLASPKSPYEDPDKDYVIDIRVIDNRIRIFVDGELSADIEDTARAARPLKGGYFGLRNFTKGTRTWYDYVKVYRLAE